MAWSASGSRPLSPSLDVLPTRRASNAAPPTSPPLSPPSAVEGFAMPPAPTTPTPTLAPPSSQRSGSATNRLFAIFFLIVCTCGIGLVSVSSLLQGSELRSARATSLSLSADISPGVRRGVAVDNINADANANRNANANTHTHSNTSPRVDAFPTKKLSVVERWQRLGDLSEYECVAWRPCKDCSPFAEVEANRSQPCNASIPNNVAGFCEIRHRETGRVQHVMEMFCDSLRPAVEFKCADFASILTYGKKATAYEHDAGFSFDKTRRDFVQDQNQLVTLPNEVTTQPDKFFKRGIAIVVYEKLLESVFASVKSLRQQGCALPVELWYIKEETNPQHPILKTLTSEYGAYMREITDKRASRFYTKIYAVFYSAFDQVLLLDADNFAVRDPTYLFVSEPFKRTGAIFWPDFWRFKKTIFNIQPNSFVWDVFDLDPVDMFEQESGQVLIDRRRHFKAMNVMMYYAFNPTLIENMRLAWGDKDLFRFAWMKTGSSFHMIEMPPGAAGKKLPDKNVFCGVTMVQHDTNHEVLFLHRNQEKLTSDNRRIVWDDLQQFRIGEVSLDEYDVRGANGGRYYPMYKRCYGKDIYYEKAFVVKPIAELPFATLESRLLDFIQEAALIANSSGTISNPK